jgi:predicted transglutaminase-like cysteine proteinase
MSAAVQSHFSARFRAGVWALGFSLLLVIGLVIGLLSPASAQSPSGLAGSITFGMETEPSPVTAVSVKWNRTKAEIARELDIVAKCRNSNACPTDARKLIDLSAAGAGRSHRDKIGLINRAVDLAISPISDDEQWGVPDRWSAPFETLQSRRGDCEDYATVKYLALIDAGIAKDDVKIVILRNTFPREEHAVVAVRVDDQWLILDNRTLTLVRDVDLTRATPEFVLDQGGVRRFVARGRNYGRRMARSS